MGFSKALQDKRQNAFTNVIRRTEPNHACNGRGHKFCYCFAIESEQTPCIAKQHFTIAGQCHRPGVAFKDGDTELLLKLLDLHRNG
ncbi:hypothetical protein FQZ97_983010 [compost metagenome]